jgi:long-subunit fatty acid transport protein
MKIQRTASFISILLALGLVPAAQAQDRAEAVATGFYGGVALRDGVREGPGLTIGPSATVWNRFVVPTTDDATKSTLVFGGYRWSNDIAVEASFNSLDKYSLKPSDTVTARGVGLNFGSGTAFGDLPNRAWNVDVFTSWSFYRAFALYGRLGYSQTEAIPLAGTAALSTTDIRRLNGVNYGLGLRYDMNSALGLRLEYGRFGRFAGEFNTSIPESDQVTVGVQFRF